MTNPSLYMAIITNKHEEVSKILSEEKTSNQKSAYNSLLKDVLSSLSTSKEETEIKEIFEISQLLVNAGADVNQIDSITQSPLILSCIYGNNKQAVLFLLKNNVNINYVDPITHWTLLNYIVFLNCLDIAKLFLSESKNDLDLANTMPLVNCIQADNKFNAAMAELLLQHIDVNTFGNHSEPSLFMSIRLENTASLEFLIAHNANVNLKNKLGKSPLACALEMENYEAAKMLVAAGANLFSAPQDLIEKGQKNPSKKAVEFFTYFKKHQEEQINREDGIKKIELSDFQNIPVTLLKESRLKELLRPHLIRILKDSELDKAWAEKMNALLSGEMTLKVKNTTLLSIIAEFANILLHVETIDQQKTNLCGPAALVSLLVLKRPKMLFDLGIKLVAQGKTQAPLSLTLSSYSTNRATSFIEILLTEIRRAHNLTGYSPESLRENFQGLTPPRLLVTWLNAFGLDEIEDLILPTTTSGRTPSKGLYFLLNVAFIKFHANSYHTFRSKEENLNYLIQKINEGKQAIVLFSADWVDEIDSKHTKAQGTNIKAVQHTHHLSILERGFTYCFKMPIDHYVLVTALTCTKERVECEFTTYGKKYKCEMNRDEFLNGYRGAIVANAEKLFQNNDRHGVSKSKRSSSCKRRLKAE